MAEVYTLTRESATAIGQAREIGLTVSLADVFLGARHTLKPPCPACRAAASPEAPADPTCERCAGSGVDASAPRIEVDVPPGVASGDRIRARSAEGSWDVVVRVRDEDPPFRRSGNHVHLDLTITAGQAERGGQVEVPTLAGPRRLRIPAGIQNGHVLRLNGFGLPGGDRISFGDQLVRIGIAEPKAAPTDALTLVQQVVSAAPEPKQPMRRIHPETLLKAIGGTALVMALLVLARLAAEARISPAVGRFTILALAALTAPLLLSAALAAAQPALAAAIGHGRNHLRRVRAGALARASTATSARLAAFLRARASQPRRSLLAALDRLSRAVEGSGRNEVGALERVQGRLAENVAALGRLRDLVDERKELTAAVRTNAGMPGAAALGVFGVVLGLAALLVAINTWFLGDVAASISMVEGAEAPGTWAVGGRVLPLSFSISALATGVVLYGLDSLGRGGSIFMKAAAYVLILGLAFVQSSAYAPVAAYLDVPGWFGVYYGQPMYLVLSYAGVLAGAIIPLVLAALGYAAWLSLDRFAVALSRRSAALKLDRNTRALVRTHHQLQALEGGIQALWDRLEAERQHGLQASEPDVGDEDTQREAALAAVLQATAEFRRSGSIGGSPPEDRTAGQVVASLLGDTLLLGVWALALVVIFRHLAVQLADVGILGPVDATLAAACLTTALGLGAFIAKDALWGSAHLALWARATPGGGGRSAVVALALAILAAGAIAALWAFAGTRGPGAGAAVGSLLATALVLVVMLASLNLDTAVVGACHGFMALAFALAWLAVNAARGAAALLEGVLATAGAVLAWAAFPARWIRSLRSAPATQ